MIFTGPIRNIYFPFDIETDTALSVATEMVAELDITDQDVTKIADMIDGEIVSLVPEWRSGVGIEDSPTHENSTSYCHNCGSGDSLVGYLSSSNRSCKNLQVLQCSKQGCATTHGRFEEITYQFEGSEEQYVSDDPPMYSSQSNGVHYSDEYRDSEPPRNENEERIVGTEGYKNEITEELRWLKDKYQMQLREVRDE